jgi:DNA-binding transcriptional MerR regulator
VSAGKKGRWLQIGEFARLAGVTVKTARYYSASGLLIPDYIEPRSSYRYYRLDQVVTLKRIRQLRALGFSLAELKIWMTAADDAFARIMLLDALRSRVQAQMSADVERLRALRKLIASESAILRLSATVGPTTRCIAPVAAYTIRDRVRSTQTVYQMFESTEFNVARHGARSTRPPFLLVHDGPYGETGADVEVCIPILKGAMSAVGGKLIAGTNRAACGRFAGPYKRGPILFKGMQRWMQSAGLRAEGPLREVYLRYGADQRGYTIPKGQLARATADYLTELQIPVAALGC